MFPLELGADPGDDFWLAVEVTTCPVCKGHDISRYGDVGSSCYACDGGMIEEPPGVLALLEPCDTCGGDGIGERCYVGAEAHCDACEGSGRREVNIAVPCPNDYTLTGDCGAFGCKGTVSRTYTVTDNPALLPVVDWYAGGDMPWPCFETSPDEVRSDTITGTLVGATEATTHALHLQAVK